MGIVRRLDHTRYRVSELEKSVDFYKRVLGLEEVRRHKSPRGSELVFLKAPESEELIELCYFPNSGPVKVQEDLTHLAFIVDSLEAFGKHLESLPLLPPPSYLYLHIGCPVRFLKNDYPPPPYSADSHQRWREQAVAAQKANQLLEKTFSQYHANQI